MIKQRHHFANKGPYSQNYCFSSSQVQTWELDHKESWTPKKWCFQTVVLEKTPESPWIARKSNQSILKEINPEYSLEGLMLKLMLQYLGHLMRRANSIEKNPDAGKDWGQEEKGTTEDEIDDITNSMDKFEQTPGDGEGQGSLVCCSSWGCRVRHDLEIEQQQQMIRVYHLIHG